MDILPSPPLPILSLWAYAHSPAVTDMMKEALQLPAMRRVKGEWPSEASRAPLSAFGSRTPRPTCS